MCVFQKERCFMGLQYSSHGNECIAIWHCSEENMEPKSRTEVTWDVHVAVAAQSGPQIKLHRPLRNIPRL